MVSSHGRVKSIARRDFISESSRIYSRERKGGILKQTSRGKCGYVCVSVDNKLYNIHRLVAIHFIRNPENKPQVNHKDGDKTNNNLSNLEWVTPSENGKHAYRELGIKPHAIGKTGILNKLSKPVMQYENGIFIKKWDAISDAVRFGGFDSGCISRCCNGENNLHKGYSWSFA
jgi:hypothetical protein